MIKVLYLIASVMLQPCATEDSSWCHWNAATQGNGQGVSFVALHDGITVYQTGELIKWD